MSKISEMELTALKDSGAFQDFYGPGITALRRSGVLGYLRRFARPYLNDNGKDQGVAAGAAMYANGYHDALDELEYFVDVFLASEKGKTPRMDFGGLKTAKLKGDIMDVPKERL